MTSWTPVESDGRPSVLFVDDEPRVLDGLRRSLHAVRRRWEIRVAHSGEEALAMMQGQPADVVVSDLQMPTLDGFVLLETIADRWPSAVRLILSGQASTRSGVQAWSVAHQYLSKPCDPETLIQALERASNLVRLLRVPAIRGIAGRLQSLPTQPRVLAELEALTAREGALTSEVAALVERDPAITAKVLQVVNSAYFGLRRPVAHVETAVSVMGFQLLRALIAGHEIGHAFPCFLPDWDPDEAHRHALQVATLARAIAEDPAEAADLFTTGLLHDVGKLVLASRAPERLIRAMDIQRHTGRPLHEIEREEDGADHADVGAYLLGLWGLPWPIVEGVALHHAPERWDAAASPLSAKIALVQEVLREAQPSGGIFLEPRPHPPEVYARIGDADAVTTARARVRDLIEAGVAV